MKIQMLILRFVQIPPLFQEQINQTLSYQELACLIDCSSKITSKKNKPKDLKHQTKKSPPDSKQERK